MRMQVIEAVFEAGTFKPIRPLKPALAEGQRVRIVVELPEESASLLDLATRVYEGLSEQEMAEVEEIALSRYR